MKAFKHLIPLLIAAVFAGCASDTKTETTPVPKAAAKVTSGDFNGDGKKETLTLVPPKLNADGTACLDTSCMAYIKFSDTTIAPIKIKSCIGGTPDILGDLNGDGKDEIGLLPDWFSSCWRNYYVFTYKNGEWINAVPPITTHCNQWDAGIKPIVKDSLNKGYVVIHYSEFDNDTKEIVNRSRITAIK
jgi:hypothetical protein